MIDGKPVAGMSLSDVRLRLLGMNGSKVELGLVSTHMFFSIIGVLLLSVHS